MKYTVLVLLLCPAAVVAETPSIIYGAGNQSCGTWLESRRNNDIGWRNDLTWSLGYISGLGALVDFRPTDSDAVIGWLDKYCTEHPIDSLAKAMNHLAKELHKS